MFTRACIFGAAKHAAQDELRRRSTHRSRPFYFRLDFTATDDQGRTRAVDPPDP